MTRTPTWKAMAQEAARLLRNLPEPRKQ